MDYFPIFIDLKNQPCLVVGAGACATRKIALLQRAGANITVIAKEISASIENNQNLVAHKKAFESTDLIDFKLVVAATNDEDVNELVSKTAKALNIPVNVVDNPKLCSFIFPAIVDRSPIVTAISSGGSAPVLARLLRAKVETLISPAYGDLARFADKFREVVKQTIIQPEKRRIFWETVFEGSIAEAIFTNNENLATQKLETLLSTQSFSESGEVYLIGAGPGAADLLTFRALRLMQQADVIVYDRLVSDEILELVRRDAERIYVGKARNFHSLPQDEINELLVNLAKSGKRVARLKGGDPFIFGRGGEEIEILVNNQITFQVVPGITAASGCASYAGIPLTHRDYAQSCVFITGHLKDGTVNLNWAQLSTQNQTLIIYMGLVGLEIICKSLIENGSEPDLPLAIIQEGTTEKQRVFVGSLQNPPDKTQIDGKKPTLIVIGNVVNLRNQLNWFSVMS